MRPVALIALLVGLVTSQTVPVAAQEASADLAISIDAGSSSAGVSVIVRYSNAGPSEASATVISIAVPSGYQMISSGADCAQAADGLVTCDVGNVPAPSADFFVLEFFPGDPGEHVIVGSIASETADPNPANNRDEDTVTVANATDLSLDLSVSGSGSVGRGDEVNLFAQFGNHGGLRAKDVVILIDLPDGIEYAGGRCAETSSGDVECRYAEVSPRSVGIEIVRLRAAGEGTFTIEGSISSATPDPNPTNNTDTVQIQVEPRADLAVAVADRPDPAAPGRIVTYTADVLNHGPSTATSVATDIEWTTTIPGGAVVVGIAAEGATCSAIGASQVRCTAAAIESGAAVSIELQLRPRGPGDLVVSAAAGAAEPDPDTSNNSDAESTTVGRAQ